MSIVSISYGSLKDASNEAKAVAKKLDSYADSIESSVYKKLNSYGGSWSSNLTNAKSKLNAKISNLRSTADKYNTYTSNLIDLRDECKNTDKSVRSTVSSLTATFKESHGIRNSKIKNAINYFFTSIGNSTSTGRWLGDGKDLYKASNNYLKKSIKEWYNYQGGKELIKGALVGALEVAIGVLAIVGAILSGGALLVLIAGVVGGIIVAANGLANIWNEGKAYSATGSNDPATGKRRSEINSWQDYLRSSFIFGDDGEDYEYNESYNAWATGIDVVNLVCTVVTVVSSCGKLLKNGYKWATGDATKLKDIKFKQIFSKDAFTAFKGKIKFGIGDGLADIKMALKYHDWSIVEKLGTRMLRDTGRNLKAEFWDFFETNGDFNRKGAVASIKNMLSIPKDILKDGFTPSNIFDVGLNSVVIPSITAFTVNSTDGTIISSEGGQMQFDFTDKITFSDLTGLFEKGRKIPSTASGLFSNGSSNNVDVISKLSSSCNINISIPEVYMPSIKMPIIRAA